MNITVTQKHSQSFCVYFLLVLDPALLTIPDSHSSPSCRPIVINIYYMTFIIVSMGCDY